ncbi:Phospholipid hydroperoxide glutathione [Globisporangium polare]
MQENSRYSDTMAALDGNSRATSTLSPTEHGHSNATESPPSATREHRQSTHTPPVALVGTVFARQQLFGTLPTELQEDTMQFRTYIELDKRWLFRKHHPALVKSVYSVKGKELIDVITHWLQTRIVHQAPALSASTSAVADLDVADEQPQRGVLSRGATFPASIKTLQNGTNNQLEHAKRIAEALVLSGFLTLYKDDVVHQNFIVSGYYVRDSELLIPVAPSVTELKTTSVWSVADGAVYAHALKRKGGVMGSKDVYVVFNDKSEKVYLFESDLARETISELAGQTMTVEFDNTSFEFGVRMDHKKLEKPELFNADTESAQLAFVIACLNIGAKYAEGNVKKLIQAEKSGLITGDAFSGAQSSNTNRATELHGVAVATTSIAELEPESHAETPHSVVFVDALTWEEHDDQHSVGEPSTSTNERQSQSVDERLSSSPNSSDHQGYRLGGREGDRLSGRLTSNGSLLGQEHHGSSPTLAKKKQEEYHPAGLFA